MKQYIVDRHTTPNTPTLEQVPTEKIPIYENLAAVESDLANLAVDQIVMTPDEGAEELLHPVAVVEKDNTHAVQSGAVASALSYSTTEQKTGGVWIDGKPIYRKIVNKTSANYQNTSDWGRLPTDTDITELQYVDTLVNVEILGFYTSSGVTYPRSIEGQQIRIKKSVPEIQYFSFGEASCDANSKVILEYTKTTD